MESEIHAVYINREWIVLDRDAHAYVVADTWATLAVLQAKLDCGQHVARWFNAGCGAMSVGGGGKEDRASSFSCSGPWSDELQDLRGYSPHRGNFDVFVSILFPCTTRV